MAKKMTYKSSGVDIDKANAFVKAIGGSLSQTRISGVMKNKGAFGALFALDIRKMKHPVLVSSSDGVGTKLLVAKTCGRHNTVGIDLVAMNVNDILCAGARRLNQVGFGGDPPPQGFIPAEPVFLNRKHMPEEVHLVCVGGYQFHRAFTTLIACPPVSLCSYQPTRIDHETRSDYNEKAAAYREGDLVPEPLVIAQAQ